MSFAKLSLMGNLGRDPEVFTYGGDKQGVKFSIAVSQGKDDKKTTDWYSCTCFGAVAKTAQSFLTKGKTVIVFGNLSMRSFTDKEGVNKTTPEINVQEIQFVPGGDPKPNGQSTGQRTTSQVPPSSRGAQPQPTDSGDDCPF